MKNTIKTINIKSGGVEKLQMKVIMCDERR